MESIDSYVQRKTNNLETYRGSAKNSKVKLNLSLRKNELSQIYSFLYLNLFLNGFSFFFKRSPQRTLNSSSLKVKRQVLTNDETNKCTDNLENFRDSNANVSLLSLKDKMSAR